MEDPLKQEINILNFTFQVEINDDSSGPEEIPLDPIVPVPITTKDDIPLEREQNSEGKTGKATKVQPTYSTVGELGGIGISLKL